MSLTKQEYLDKLYEATEDGTFPSCTPRDKKCLYRGPDGKKCAGGLLIPNEDYREFYEEMIFQNLPNDLLDKIVPNGMTEWDVRDLQISHDTQCQIGWDKKEFFKRLNSFSFFADCTKKELK